jgi:four helix bundle protein
MEVRSYKDLRVWQRAIELVCASYDVSRRLPAEERTALGDQLRRAAVSVAANIAEGHSRAHRKEFLQFLAVAHASLTELETHLTIALRVGYIPNDAYAAAATLSDEVSRMLTAMRRRLGEPRLAVPRRSSPDAPGRPTLDA